MKPRPKPRRAGFGFVVAVLSAFGCNGIGCEGCGGVREYPSHPAAMLPDGGPTLEGGVSVKTGFNNCPTVSVQAGPIMVRVGQALRVTGRGSDLDPADILLYMWTATAGGYFGDDREQETTFTCSDAGPVTITLTVSDGRCQTTTDVAVFCLAIRDGGPDGSGGGGSGGGDGGGTGVVDNCPAAEPSSGGAMCPDCTTQQCALGPAPATDGCCGLESATDRRLCATVYACFASKGCTFGGDPTGCYCGTSGPACYSGGANGPCVAEVQEAAKSVDPSMIQSRWVSGMLPLGRAVNLAVCRGSFCAEECAIH